MSEFCNALPEGSGFVLLRRDKQVVFYKERTREHTPVCDRRERRSKARDVPRYEAKKMEPAVGFEPTTW